MSTEPGNAATAMDCREMERSLEPYLDGEFEAREQAEAASHLASCERCRALADARARTREIVRRKLREAMGPDSPAGRAPEALRLRVAEALSRERGSPWRLLLSPIPVAALAACAAGAVLVLVSQPASDPLIEEAVRKHARDLPLEVIADRVGPESIPEILAPKLDFNARLPHFRAPEMRLMGARISQIREQPAAYMRYEMPRGKVGLFIIDDPDRRIGSGGRAVQLGPSTVRLMNSRGYNVAVWRRNEIVYSLVSDLDEGDLVRLVGTAQGAIDR